ncbi:hypothetical protein EV05_1347 [Prochlorococcus sp. MIT 0601]|nr:hypothetical protein EV05_1347 [Prochlorococcus sp. MIT 0601]
MRISMKLGVKTHLLNAISASIFYLTASHSMTSKALDDFIDECFVGNDPICNLYREDTLWLDAYASRLIAEMPTPIEEG